LAAADLTQYQQFFIFFIETKSGSIVQFIMPSLANMGKFIRIRYKLKKTETLNLLIVYKEMYAKGQALRYVA